MKVGLQISSFTWPGGAAAIGPTLARIVRQADDLGFDSIWVMDHFFQIRGVGQVEEPMLEGLTTLGFMAAQHVARPAGADGRRRPLPRARAVGQGRDDARRAVGRPGLARHRGGLERARVARARVPVPAARATGSRCSRRRCRSATRCSRASAAREAAFDGRQFQAERLLNSPAVALAAAGADHGRRRRREEDAAPRGAVRRRVQRLRSPEAIAHKYEILREHCADVGRDPDEIERSTLQNIDPVLPGGGGRETVERIIDRFGDLADAGAQHIILGHAERRRRRAASTLIGRDILPACGTC